VVNLAIAGISPSTSSRHVSPTLGGKAVFCASTLEQASKKSAKNFFMA
jgi:hypothetical protein